MTDLVLRRQGSHLIPAGSVWEDDLRALPEGVDLLAKVSRPRSLQMHRLFWSLLAKVANATKYESAEKLLLVLKLTLGYADTVQLPGGKIVPVAQSISFSSMSQDRFREFFERAIDLIAEFILPAVQDDALVTEIYAMLDKPQVAA